MPKGRSYGTTWIPVGFSKAGAFASIWYLDDDMRPAWNFGVQSLVTDKMLDSVDLVTPHGGSPQPLEVFLTERATEIAALLSKHEIEVDPPEALEDDSELFGRYWLTHLESSTRGGKRVDTLHAAMGAELLGTLESPLEARLAVLLLVHKAGHEGIQECRIRVVGADLGRASRRLLPRSPYGPIGAARRARRGGSST